MRHQSINVIHLPNCKGFGKVAPALCHLHVGQTGYFIYMSGAWIAQWWWEGDKDEGGKKTNELHWGFNFMLLPVGWNVCLLEIMNEWEREERWREREREREQDRSANVHWLVSTWHFCFWCSPKQPGAQGSSCARGLGGVLWPLLSWRVPWTKQRLPVTSNITVQLQTRERERER